MVQLDYHIKLIIKLEYVLWLMPHIFSKPLLIIFHILTLMDLKLSIKIKQKLKNGAKNTI
jgi:hypothetical protein